MSEPLYGPQTQLALQNFPISGQTMPRAFLAALARIKHAAAGVNSEHSVISSEKAAAIQRAAQRVLAGELWEQFPLDVFQTGSGTSTNMNMNEVLAALASRELSQSVHPNDEVNASTSSNDVIPSAMHVSAAIAVRDELLPALDGLACSLERQADECATVIKAGRTHLMDATPITLGEEFCGYAGQLRAAASRVQSVLPELYALPLGGTAVGTGVNAPAEFARAVCETLAHDTGVPFVETQNHYALAGARDAIVALSAAERGVAVSVTKLCNDLRLMSSGPRTGLGEITLPTLQPGSSIMPGKVNPVLPEAALMVGARVIGNDATIAYAGTTGALELNVMMPVMASSVLESTHILSTSARVLAENCVRGIEANVEQCRRYAETTPALATLIAPELGYDETARLVRESLEHNVPITELLPPELVQRVLNSPAQP